MNWNEEAKKLYFDMRSRCWSYDRSEIEISRALQAAYRAGMLRASKILVNVYGETAFSMNGYNLILKEAEAEGEGI